MRRRGPPLSALGSSLAAGGVARRLSERARATANPPSGEPQAAASLATGMQGLLDQMAQGLGHLVAAAQAAAAAPGPAAEQGHTMSLGGRDARVVFGYSIRMGQAGLSAEPFGDLPDTKTAHAPAPDAAARQPIVDIFEDGDDVLIVAELPGVHGDHIACSADRQVLHITAKGPRRYAKDVTLPAPVLPESLRSACHNGILEVRLRRAGTPA